MDTSNRAAAMLCLLEVWAECQATADITTG